MVATIGLGMCAILYFFRCAPFYRRRSATTEFSREAQDIHGIKQAEDKS